MSRGIVYFIAALLGIVSALAAAMEYEVIQVSDRGMEPAYQEGDLVFVERYDYERDGSASWDGSIVLERGDVVIVENPVFQETGEGLWMLKRIAGVPGDIVSIVDGRVYVNGVAEEVSESTKGDIRTCMEEQEVPSDAYFVLGDNRGQSSDSRDEAIGMVKKENIRGKVIEKW